MQSDFVVRSFLPTLNYEVQPPVIFHFLIFSLQDLNSACPIDLVCNRGCGSALMTKSNRLFEILDAMSAQLPSRSVTIKIRTGWNEKAPIAHELIPQIQTRFNNKLSAIMVSVDLIQYILL